MCFCCMSFACIVRAALHIISTIFGKTLVSLLHNAVPIVAQKVTTSFDFLSLVVPSARFALFSPPITTISFLISIVTFESDLSIAYTVAPSISFRFVLVSLGVLLLLCGPHNLILGLLFVVTFLVIVCDMDSCWRLSLLIFIRLLMLGIV